MSRMATNEYIGAKRRTYAESSPGKRRRILGEVCETTGYSRKYANRLLTGSRKFKERKGRGATYTERDKAVLIRIWREVEAELRRLCEDYSAWRNFCVPCKMLVAKIKRRDSKGFACRYDKPQTPYARVLADPDVPQEAKDALKRRKAKINGIELYHRILKRLRRVRRLQGAAKDSSPVRSALAPCGATPPGTAFAPGDGGGATSLSGKKTIRKVSSI